MKKQPTIPMVRPAALTIGFRLLDEAVALCLEAGESAANVRRHVLYTTDRIVRESGISVHTNSTTSHDSIKGCVGNIAVLLNLISKKI